MPMGNFLKGHDSFLLSCARAALMPKGMQDTAFRSTCIPEFPHMISFLFDPSFKSDLTLQLALLRAGAGPPDLQRSLPA